MYSLEPHIHLSAAKLQQHIIELNDTWAIYKRFGTRPEIVHAKPLRVHVDGWSNRPPPERPKRGRMSQEPNRKLKIAKRLMKKHGDLLSLGNLKNVKIISPPFENSYLYNPIDEYEQQHLESAPVGPYMYIGPCDINSEISDEQNRWHRLFFRTHIINVKQTLLDNMTIVSRIDNANV
jgi:hypothetical protein